VTTHDLATLPGYWHGHDLVVRAALNQFPSNDVKATSIKLRERDRHALIRALVREGLLPRDAADSGQLTNEILIAIYRFIARTPSLLMLMGLEDVAGEEEQANLPGTVDQHPNWQRKLSLTVEALKSSDRLKMLVRAIASERGPSRVAAQESGP